MDAPRRTGPTGCVRQRAAADGDRPAQPRRRRDLRHSAAAISALLALLFVPLIFAPALPEHTRELVQKATPGAGVAVQQTVARGDAVPIARWTRRGVTFAWAAGALLLALFLIRRRDA